MLINIRVVPKASRNLVKEENGKLKVYVTSPAQDGLANARVIALLAEYFHVKKYDIEIIRGDKSRDKTVRITDGAKSTA
jgi:uncharacterized protein (TIGR00251 family)